MLLCVAGGSGAEFTRDRPRAGSRCSSQSFLIKTNANQQVMVEERCSMTSSVVSTDHVAARATLSLHLRTNKDPARSHTCSKEPSVAYRSRVIVVSGEDAAFCSEKGETCSTTTTFKSNVVNGKRGTNTILVRYKPSKPVSEDSDDELRFEFYPKNEGISSPTISSSPPSTISSESSSSKKDKTSTSAWAQIMELEGYRSPAIGLDNCPSKHAPAVVESDSVSNFSSLSGESYRSELSAANASLCNSYLSRQSETPYSGEHPFNNSGEEGRFRKHNIVSIASKCDSGPLRLTDAAQMTADVNHGSENPDFVLNQADSNQKQALSVKPKGPVQNRYGDTCSKNISYHDVSRTDPNIVKISPKYKSSMLRSESSRTPKMPPVERNKNRRKTLPDGNLSLNPSNSSVTKRDSVAKNQKSPEHDPNASWGRYNSRAMRDSVRKVAEKYAETVYMRRQTRSLLDSLPEAKGVQLTRYVAPSNELDHAHLSKRVLQLHAKRAGSTSHLHEIPNETETLHRSRLHIIMPASTRHDHSDVHATNDCKMTSYESESCKLNQKLEKEKSLMLGENFRINNTVDEDSLSDDPKLIQVSDPYFENGQTSCMGTEESRRNFVLDSHNPEEGRSRNMFSNTKMYHTPHSSKHFQKNISSIECKISSDESKHPFHLSVNMKDIKSKLCADCAQSTEFGPPAKQSACRGKHHLNDTCSRNAVKVSQISVLKRTPLIIDEEDSLIRPLRSPDIDSKFENSTRKCTMLTAREMAELVHGKGNTDSKFSHAGVTSKVSSWIQKQKDKRKPVFFIGDTPSFFIEKSSENDPEVNSKTLSRKSRRSLSLSNVREGEVSKSCNGTSNASEFKCTSNAEEVLPKSNEHKGLFIKRTSSSCSNRGSIRRKSRQGSPVREESESLKDPNWNRVDGCVTPWNNRFKSKTKNDYCEPILPRYESNSKTNTGIFISKARENYFASEVAIQSPEERFENSIESFRSVKPQPVGDKRFSTKVLGQQSDNKEFTYEDSLNSSLLGSQGSRHSYSIIATRDVDDLVRPERTAVSKKLLNFKQITRALSLHSLKKKTKDVPICSNTVTHLETAPVVSLSKWTRGSKRKIENLKYGSLRKSVSYCELTARGAKISGKLEFPVNLLNETKKVAKRPAMPSRPSSTPSRPSSTCACSSNLRRSVSLFWQFPLQKPIEYTTDDPKCDLVAKIWFSRLHYRNTFLPFLRDVKNKRHPTSAVPESVNHQHLDSESRVSLVDYKHPSTNHPSCLDGKQDFSRTAPDTTNSEDPQKNLTSLDQIWRANPVKLCRVHSRLLMCRHKGRYRLRRSISQPVELEMTGSIHNLRESTHGSADHDSFQKGSLSSEDEASSESDIYHSYCCSPTRRSNTCWELSGDGNMYAEALWDHETLDSEELPFLAGDIIEVTDTSDQDWWWGTKDGQGGWFPSAFVRLYVSHRGPSLHFNGQQSDGIQIPYSPCKVSMNNLSCEQVRANIVQEIVATERDYVKHLKDVVEGYLKQVHRRPDMFSKERIETVFGNIKDIYTFQSQFLKELEDCLDKDSPNLSQIGNCFLNHKEEFKIYSQYCNNHPLAVSELQELYCDSQYIHFFEACRLLQEMIDISLDGFLLTPIQRICKYPLQLAELLKFTDSNHPDHVPVSNALAAMKEVAELVNERKRRMECLERIAEWQSTIEGWEGPDVLDTSSVLIHCGEVTRVSSSWSRDIYLFIFDHQLIYCKKDLLKRHTYAYKGRLNLDHCDIIDVEDGKDSQFAVNVKNAWKIYCRDKEKWYLFYAKTYPEKEQWLRAFKAERQRVNDDEKQAFVVTEEAKRSARLAVHNKQKPKRPRVKFTKGRRCHPDVAVTELLLDSPNAKSRSGSLPSNIHPELAIMAGAKMGPTRKKGSGWFHFGSGKKPKS